MARLISPHFYRPAIYEREKASRNNGWLAEPMNLKIY